MRLGNLNAEENYPQLRNLHHNCTLVGVVTLCMCTNELTYCKANQSDSWVICFFFTVRQLHGLKMIVTTVSLGKSQENFMLAARQLSLSGCYKIINCNIHNCTVMVLWSFI